MRTLGSIIVFLLLGWLPIIGYFVGRAHGRRRVLRGMEDEAPRPKRLGYLRSLAR